MISRFIQSDYVRMMIIVLIASFFVSCGPQPTMTRLRHIFFALYDETGSMPPVNLEEGKKYTKEEIIPSMQPGDKFILAKISKNSFDADYVDYKVYSLWESPTYTPDKRTKAHNDSVLKELMADIDSVRVRKENVITDVGGALYKAEQTFSADSLAEKWLIIFSDLENNVVRHLKLSLKGVRVYALFVSHKYRECAKCDEIQAWQAKQEYWTKTFHKAGASNSYIWDADQTRANMDQLANQIRGY